MDTKYCPQYHPIGSPTRAYKGKARYWCQACGREYSKRSLKKIVDETYRPPPKAKPDQASAPEMTRAADNTRPT
jgi:transposase-like protein